MQSYRRRGVSARTRTYATVAVAALAAAGLVVAAVAFTRTSTGGGIRARLLYGAALQRLGRSVEAEREFAAAARSAPGDDEAQVAAAVGRFSKARPAAAFARLGPLSGRFPRSQSVRFHLGELLLWLRQVPQAEQQLRLARALGSRTPLGRTSKAFLAELSALRTR